MTAKEWIGIFGSLSALIIVIVKWVIPRIAHYLDVHRYNNTVGHQIIKDLETKLGKQAPNILVEFMRNSTADREILANRLDKLENHAGLGIYVCDPVGKCIYANTTLSNMFGLPRQEMTGYGWLQPIVDKRTAFQNWQFSVQNKIPYRDEYEIVVGGNTHTCVTYAEPSRAEGADIVLGYVGTVSFSKESENG